MAALFLNRGLTDCDYAFSQDLSAANSHPVAKRKTDAGAETTPTPAPPSPDTGDESALTLWLLAAAAGMAGILFLCGRRRRLSK